MRRCAADGHLGGQYLTGVALRGTAPSLPRSDSIPVPPPPLRQPRPPHRPCPPASPRCSPLRHRGGYCCYPELRARRKYAARAQHRPSRRHPSAASFLPYPPGPPLVRPPSSPLRSPLARIEPPTAPRATVLASRCAVPVPRRPAACCFPPPPLPPPRPDRRHWKKQRLSSKMPAAAAALLLLLLVLPLLRTGLARLRL